MDATQMLQGDESYLEERGCLILRTLCKFMNAQTVMSQLADIIAVIVGLVSHAESRRQAVRRALRADAERDPTNRRGGRRGLQDAPLLLLPRCAEDRGTETL